MDLCVRPAEPADFPACAALPCGGLAYTRIGPADLIRAWTRLLADDALIACVAEDRDLPPEPRLVGFAATVFVSDAWVRAAGASSEPYLAARTLAADEARRTPVLRPREVDATNRGHGVNILNLHYAEHPQLGREDAVFLRHQMMQSFLAEFRGYHVRDVIQEFWDEIEPEFILNGWGRVRNDYAVWHGKRTGSADPAARRPYLVGFSRTEAQALPGDVMASLFVHLPSRFAFSIAEKRLLQHARHGLTDSELATTMGVALLTIKSQWRAVYARVARVAPGLLGDTRTEHLQSIHRGQEKRRRLLDYLQRHPEELRPSLYERRRAR